jgi:predicted Zn-dependent protease with MMP-like domain
VSADLSPEEFDAAVSDALDQVPGELAALMDNVVVLVEEMPPATSRRTCSASTRGPR